MQLCGAEIIVHALAAEGVEYVFGYPGGSVLEIYDALYKNKAFQHILARHEQAAVHMADAYARASGKVGVALVTSGPGATNTVTSIATAFSDSIPIVVISGEVASNAIGSDAFQEVDMVGITRHCVKHNFLIKDVKDLAFTLKKAFYIARTGRPGPVVIDIAKDATQEKTQFSYLEGDPFIRSYQPVVQGHTGQIKKAAQLLSSAKRPLVYFGGGVIASGAEHILTRLVQKLGAPVASTLMGLGAYPSTHAQFLGMLGMHGTYEANLAMQRADVVLALGARFDDRVVSVPSKFLAETKKIIHIDIDPSSIAKRVAVDVPIVGDVKAVLEDLLSILDQSDFNSAQLSHWWQTIEKWRNRQCLYYDDEAPEIKAQYVIETLAKLTHGQAILSSDVGQHQMFVAQYYPFQRVRQWLSSGGLGTMGVGLPYAMGARFAFPGEDIFCITGDGSIQMNIQELATCKQYKLPVKIININNGYLGMVRQWQEFYYEGRYSSTFMEGTPDFVRLAEAYGHVGMKITKKADVEPALKEAIALKDRLVFLDFITMQEQNVYPMVGNGKGLDEMLLPPHMREQAKDADVFEAKNKNYDIRSVP